MKPSSKFIQTDKITKQQWQIRLSPVHQILWTLYLQIISQLFTNGHELSNYVWSIWSKFEFGPNFVHIYHEFNEWQFLSHLWFFALIVIFCWFFFSRLSKTPSVHIKCWGRFCRNQGNSMAFALIYVVALITVKRLCRKKRNLPMYIQCDEPQFWNTIFE